MKCPRCNTDMTGNNKCGKCGLNVAENREELEVEYKDFKTSELLEIRQKKRTIPSGTVTDTSRKPLGAGTQKSEMHLKPSPEYKKSSFLFFAVIGLIMALIIGGVILVRFLILY
jgi:hypothetical protein